MHRSVDYSRLLCRRIIPSQLPTCAFSLSSPTLSVTAKSSCDSPPLRHICRSRRSGHLPMVPAEDQSGRGGDGDGDGVERWGGH
jgi:hypothetical protein